MGKKVLIIDYNHERRLHLHEFLRARFKDWEIDELATHSPEPPRDTDVNKLAQVSSRRYDLLIGHLGGNPSGFECLKVFKDTNPKGKAVLYTKNPSVQIELLGRLKLADRVFKRSDVENILFDNADEMMNVIEEVMKNPSLTYWKNPFTEPTVLTAIIGLLTAIVGLIAALFKAGTP